MEIRGPAAVAGAVLGAALALACDRFDDAPLETASSFWTAIQDGDLEAARTLTTAPGDPAVEELAAQRPQAIAFGPVLRNEDTALVETTALLEEHGGEITFNTHLRREAAGWRVDARASRRALTREALAGSFEALRESLRESSEMLVEEFERRALEATEALRGTLEELERSLREG